MATPTLEGCKTYLESSGVDTTALASDISECYATETAAQLARCKVPDDGATPPVLVYSDDLVSALYRRVAHALALRPLPLGVQAVLAEGAVATTRVGGLDAEVARLEGPYRKRTVG
jgi:hypothetical protein